RCCRPASRFRPIRRCTPGPAVLLRGVLEFANDAERRTQAQIESVSYFLAEMEARRSGDGTDLISEMLRTEVDGEAIPDEFILGTVALTLIAGLDTTWSALGSMLWHL